MAHFPPFTSTKKCKAYNEKYSQSKFQQQKKRKQKKKNNNLDFKNKKRGNKKRGNKFHLDFLLHANERMDFHCPIQTK